MGRNLIDSGCMWIGKVPETWKVTALKRVRDDEHPYPIGDGDHGSIKPEHYIDEGIPYIRVQNLSWGGDLLLDDVVYISEEINKQNEKSILHPHDILVAKTGGTIGKTGLIPESMSEANTTSSVGKVTISKKYDYKYYFYVIGSEVCYQQMWEKARQKSAQPGFNIDDLVDFKIPLPPVEEQYRISSFLDKQCEFIDNVLEKTKQSIEEYKKMKQSLITQSICKGLDCVELKDSGSVWFGQVPAHWEIKRIKYQFYIKKDIAGEEGHTVLSITQKGIKPKDLSRNEGQLAENYSNYQLVDIGDFAMNHMDLLTGWVDISQYEGVTSPDYRVFCLKDVKNNNPRYFLYMMQMCYSNKIFYGLGQGVSNLGRWRLQADKFLNFYIPVPPLEEQNKIASYLDTKCEELEELISKKEDFLKQLESYKKNFIFEYVTGKKEVPDCY